MFRLLATLVVVGLVAGACSTGTADSQEDSQAGAPTPLECEIEEYPCSLSEVPIEILERSDTLSDDVVDMFESGSSSDDVDTWLNEQEGMAEVESDEQTVRFRLDGGRGTWILRGGSFPSRGTFGTASSLRPALGPLSGSRFNVVGPDEEEKQALVLSPMWWDFGETDDGPRVAEILGETRGYSRVDFSFNNKVTSSDVTFESFKGWEQYDVVHVVSHGTRICKDQSCRAVIASNFVPRDEAPEGKEFVTKVDKKGELEKYRGLTDRGLDIGKAEGSRGLELLEPLVMIFLTADFFKGQYPDGLKDTLIFFNACRTLKDGASDLADALRGSSSVFVGWSEFVAFSTAFSAGVGLYEELSEGGYPVSVAYSRLDDNLKTDPLLADHARLMVAERRDGDGLRIRDVVELMNPGTTGLLSASSVIPIIGTQGDGEPDSVGYSVQIDGMTKEFASETILHVSVDGVETEPQPITNGEVNERDQWLVTGEIPLGFDVEEDTTVNFRAWVELHSGGESDDETPATVTGAEPIMGYVWTMDVTLTVGLAHGRSLVSTAMLTLEFEDGQDVNEPHPRYVVTGGTVTYEDRSSSAVGCTYSGGGLTYEVTPNMLPVERSALSFDTTVTPVEYSGVIVTEGPDDVVVQDCTALGANTYGIEDVSYGGNKAWMVVSQSDHLQVVGREFIQDTVVSGASVVRDFTITRVK